MEVMLVVSSACAVYEAIYLNKLTRRQLIDDMAELLGLTSSQLSNVYTRAPTDINVHVTDNVRLFMLLFVYFLQCHLVFAHAMF